MVFACLVGPINWAHARSWQVTRNAETELTPHGPFNTQTPLRSAYTVLDEASVASEERGIVAQQSIRCPTRCRRAKNMVISWRIDARIRHASLLQLADWITFET
jgi:hypothetical protein